MEYTRRLLLFEETRTRLDDLCSTIEFNERSSFRERFAEKISQYQDMSNYKDAISMKLIQEMSCLDLLCSNFEGDIESITIFNQLRADIHSYIVYETEHLLFRGKIWTELYDNIVTTTKTISNIPTMDELKAELRIELVNLLTRLNPSITDNEKELMLSETEYMLSLYQDFMRKIEEVNDEKRKLNVRWYENPSIPIGTNDITSGLIAYVKSGTPGLARGPQRIADIFIQYQLWATANKTTLPSSDKIIGRVLGSLGVKKIERGGRIHYELLS